LGVVSERWMWVEAMGGGSARVDTEGKQRRNTEENTEGNPGGIRNQKSRKEGGKKGIAQRWFTGRRKKWGRHVTC
jgi:hypothetical protein